MGVARPGTGQNMAVEREQREGRKWATDCGFPFKRKLFSSRVKDGAADIAKAMPGLSSFPYPVQNGMHKEGSLAYILILNKVRFTNWQFHKSKLYF